MSADFSYLSAFLIGLAGSAHCFGMCGGIVSAFSMLLPKQTANTPYLIAYNLGRIGSYVLAGALTGWLGAVISSSAIFATQLLTLISGVFLLLLGCYIAGWWRILMQLEQAGQLLWQHLGPISKRFLPMKTPLQAIPYGMIWGWLPCGLVYSTLTWSIASGSAISGATIMLCFGLGTLPAMLLVGLSSEGFVKQLADRRTKQVIGGLLVCYALYLVVKSLRVLLS